MVLVHRGTWLLTVEWILPRLCVAQGLGNKFLSHIREVDSIVQVVRCFEDSDIVHVNGAVDPASDIDIINLELALADLSQVRLRTDANWHKLIQSDASCIPSDLSLVNSRQLTSSIERPLPPQHVLLTRLDHLRFDNTSLSVAV